MASKSEDFLQPNDVILIIRVFIPEMSQDFNLNPSLMLEARIILDNLNSNFFIILMVYTFISLSEASSS